MKTLKSMRDMLPLHYWTGMIAGVIYGIWVRISFYAQEQDYHEQSFPLGWIVLALGLFPRWLHVVIADTLMDWIPDNANWEVIYHYGGYILAGIGFVLLGIIVGKTSNNPQRDAKKRLAIIVLFGIGVFMFVCYACMLAWISN